MFDSVFILTLDFCAESDGKRKENVSECNQEHVHGGPGQVGAGQQEARHVGLELAGAGKCHGMEGRGQDLGDQRVTRMTRLHPEIRNRVR